MPEIKEVFETVSEKVEPDLDSWTGLERRRRRSVRSRKWGAVALAASLTIAAIACQCVSVALVQNTASAKFTPSFLSCPGMFAEWSMTYLAQNDQPARLRINRDLEELYFTVNTNAAEALRQMRGLLREDQAKPTLAAV